MKRVSMGQVGGVVIVFHEPELTVTNDPDRQLFHVAARMVIEKHLLSAYRAGLAESDNADTDTRTDETDISAGNRP